MIEILNFIFQSFWHWLGTVILVSMLVPWGRFSLINIQKEK